MAQSLVRSSPGVGLYYALLNVLQSNLSSQDNRPDNATQAFCFGLMARSLVSFVMLPTTVIKVRYESGRFQYPSLAYALKNAYLNSNGWVGIVPTVLRDSLFSGIYYMCYIKLKADRSNDKTGMSVKQDHLINFRNGIISGFVASFVTNPIDVVKTNIQIEVNNKERISMRQVMIKLKNQPGGYLRFFDGLAPRSVRRTLIAASTWTFYELVIGLVNYRN